MTTHAFAAVAALLFVAACGGASDVQPVAMTGGDLASPAAVACRAAIAEVVGVPASDVVVFDVAESEAGVGVRATVAGAEAPWACLADSDGHVQGVTYTGSEGRL